MAQHTTPRIRETISVTGPLTDAQLRARPVPVTGVISSGTITVTGVATEATLTAIAGYVDGLEAALATLNGKDFATQTTLALIAGYVDGIESALATLNAKDFATQTTLAALNAKLVSGTDIGDVTINNAAGAAAVNVQDGGNSLTVDGTVAVSALSGTVAVTQSGTWDEVGINDSGNSITVDNATISVVGGGAEATAQRVTIASDSTGVLSVDDNGGSLTIDGTVAVSSLGGTVAVTQSGTWDEVGINDSGNSITVDDGGGSVTVDGTVAATQSGTWTEANSAAIAASASVLDDWDESDRAKVNIIAGQAGVQGGSGTTNALTQRVVLATDVALPAGNNNIGDVDIASTIPPQNRTLALDTLNALNDQAFISTRGCGTVYAVINPTSLIGNVSFVGQSAAGGEALIRSVRIDNGELATGITNPTGVTGWLIPCAGLDGVYLRMLSYTSGSTVVAADASAACGTVALSHPPPIAIANSATASSVAESASSVTLVAANPLRKSLSIRNDAATALYLGLGVAATTAMPIQIPVGAFYEIPVPIYTGQINGIWTGTGGNARVLELT